MAKGVYNHGNINQLLRFKPFLANEVHTNTLGSPENERLLNLLKPKHWFSAHLHVKFSCIYRHEKSSEQEEEKTTKFLSLDKCLPRRKFLQIIDIGDNNSDKEKTLSLDPEWMCILKKTDRLLSVDSYNQAPISFKENITITEKDIEDMKEDFQNCFEIPSNFKHTAPPYVQNSDETPPTQDIYLNEQTTLLCEMLNIRDPIRVLLEKRGKSSLINDSTTQLYNNLLDDSD